VTTHFGDRTSIEVFDFLEPKGWQFGDEDVQRFLAHCNMEMKVKEHASSNPFLQDEIWAMRMMILPLLMMSL
jgi:hypothetical protein